MGLDSEIGIYELYDRTMASVRRCLSDLGYFIGPSTLEDRSEQFGRGLSKYLTLNLKDSWLRRSWRWIR